MSAYGFFTRRVVSAAPVLRLSVAAGLLWRHRRRIEAGYAGRVAFMMATSLLGAALSLGDRPRFGRPATRTTWDGPVLFILGFWRSGTTLLHDLVARDPRFATPTLVDANTAPFLAAGRVIGPWLAPILPPDRGYDSMVLDVAGPWEEEGMLFSLSGLSPYLTALFPKDFREFDSMLDLRGLPESGLREWRRSYVTICGRVTRGATHKTVLFKSPPGAARLPLIMETFPQAKFLHLSRDPEVVFASNMRMMRQVGETMRLQHETDDDIAEHVLHRFEVIYDRYAEDFGKLPPGRVANLTYEQLLADPLGSLEEAYERLDLPGFGAIAPEFSRLLDARASYRTNVHAPLSPQRRSEIAQRWGPHARRWGYYADSGVEFASD